MKTLSKSMAVTCLTLGLAVAALGAVTAAQAQDEMHGVDLLHPGAEFAPQMPGGLTPAGPLAGRDVSSTPRLLEEHQPRLLETHRLIPGVPSIHTQEGRELNGCTGAPALPNQQIGSDQTFCGFGSR
jgi:hypothetical protein